MNGGDDNSDDDDDSDDGLDEGRREVKKVMVQSGIDAVVERVTLKRLSMLFAESSVSEGRVPAPLPLAGAPRPVVKRRSSLAPLPSEESEKNKDVD